MEAIVYTEYGSPGVLRVKEVDKPVPKENEVLVRVHATTVNYGDLVARNFKSITPARFNMPFLFWIPTRLAFGVRKPRVNILGSEFAGEVKAAGRGVTRFKKGDQVFGYLGQRMGAYAEYLVMPEDGSVAIKPANLTYAEAAVVPYGALMALNLLRKADIQPGQKVLVNGASGAIGSAAVQLARHYGADVTGVCGTPRVEFVKALGAERVIDYTQEDFTQSGETYDLILDILGKSPFSRCKRSLKPGGVCLYASFKMRQLAQMMMTSIRGGKRVVCALASDSQQDLVTIKELVEAGEIKSIVDQRYPMDQAAEAHRYVETGRKKGPVVLTLE